MKRPSIALALICKNEGANIGPLIQSVAGCFDEIYVTDTGSTDNTVELLKSDKVRELAGCPIYVSHFEWCEDFAKARNFAFDQVPKNIDYIMWLDCDDSLGDKEKFIHFRDHTMHCAHMWLATYHYAFNNQGQPVCSFLRERIIKNGYGFEWNFFLHEGLIPPKDKKYKAQAIHSWVVNHRRTEDDMKKDAGRNIRIFEKHLKDGPLIPRMQYYYGKELYDAGRYLEACDVLNDAIIKHATTLEPHDRVMAIQYLGMSYFGCEKYAQTLATAMNGMQLSPDRAEFWILAGDANVKMGRVKEAIPYYEGAKKCSAVSMGGLTFTSPAARINYPSYQIAQIAGSMGDAQTMIAEASLLKAVGDPLGEQIEVTAKDILKKATGPKAEDLIQTNDILITCPPTGAMTDWDERSIVKNGAGGSETACIEVARLLKQKTGLPVKVFQPRKTADKMESGVEYIPSQKLVDYAFKYKPKVHIAWRHSAPLTPAPTFVWSHDLVTPGAEDTRHYSKYLCLSEFHKEFVKDVQQVTDDKIAVVSNGIDPTLFSHREMVQKVPHKVIFSSSPDRGMERCIEIVKRCQDEFPDIELHLFYGFENMRKFGMADEANRLEKMIRDHSFVKYHGFVTKDVLMNHFMESAVWLYPADFIETSCITAMEAMCARTWPIVRAMGALPYTLKEAIEKNQCDLLYQDASCAEEYNYWADKLKEALRLQKWKTMDINPQDYSWQKATEGIMKVMGLQ